MIEKYSKIPWEKWPTDKLDIGVKNPDWDIQKPETWRNSWLKIPWSGSHFGTPLKSHVELFPCFFLGAPGGHVWLQGRAKRTGESDWFKPYPNIRLGLGARVDLHGYFFKPHYAWEKYYLPDWWVQLIWFILYSHWGSSSPNMVEHLFSWNQSATTCWSRKDN